MHRITHQYIERETARIKTETLYGDRFINLLYSGIRERTPLLFKALISSRMSSLLGFLNYDLDSVARMTGARRFLHTCGIDLSECVDDAASFRTLRQIFERKIRYWEVRPMPDENDTVVSPADARMITGSFRETSLLHIKEKFFDFTELLDSGERSWTERFEGGDFAVFRLTPDKYHYNHTPVSGRVVDHYEIPGHYHPCNPTSVLCIATPLSKNKRVVTIIDTDVPKGTGIGLVAMIEVVALMIGEIVQCYSERAYDDPRKIQPGLFLKKGLPKSLYRPGSSTDILIFQNGRIRFDEDLVINRNHPGVQSRYNLGSQRPLAETEVAVRSGIARIK